MTDQEKEIVNLLADVWNKFNSLPVQHPADVKEFETLIHSSQRVIMAREAMRNNPDTFKQ